MIKFVISLVLLSLCITVNSQVNYYVSPTGSNSFSGLSESDPWENIQYALATAGAGDEIRLMTGTFDEGTIIWSSGGIAGSPMILTAAAGANPVLTGLSIGSFDPVLVLNNVNHIQIKNLEFTSHDGNYQPVIYLVNSTSEITISNCTFRDMMWNEGYGILKEGSGDGIIIENNSFFNLLGNNALGIAIYGTDPVTPITNVTVKNNLIYDCEPAPSEALTLNGNIDGFAILDNTVHDVDNIGIDMIGGEPSINPNPAVNFARNGICSGNLVYNANSSYGGGFGAGIYVDGGSNILVEKNEVYGSDLGFEIGCENPGLVTENITLRNNLIYRNEKAGIVIGGYNYPATGKVANSIVEHNTCWDNDILETGFGQLWIQYTETSDFRHNIFISESESVLLNAQGIDATQGNIFDYNIWNYAAGTAQFIFDGTLISGWSGYQIATGHDANSINADAGFVDASLFDFNLSASSFAIDSGDPIFIADVDETDFAGNTRVIDGLTDIGAFEYAALISCTQVTGLNSTITAAGVQLNYSPVASATAYRVEGKPAGGASFKSLPIVFAPNTNALAPASKLTSGITYSWKVTAACSADYTLLSPPSALSSFVWPSPKMYNTEAGYYDLNGNLIDISSHRGVSPLLKVNELGEKVLIWKGDY